MRRLLYGILSAFLLLPVPVIAAINFGTNTWSIIDNTGTGFFSLADQSPSSVDLVFHAPNDGNFSNQPTTVVIMSTGTITGTSGDTIKSTLSNFIPVRDIQNGTYTVNIDVTGVNATNSFATGPNPTTAGPFTTGTVTGDPIGITITLNFSGHFQFIQGAKSGTVTSFNFSTGN